jgi:hypothetical protein
MLVRALLLSLCFCVSATAQQNAEWRQPFPPFKLIGNVYWVGTYDLSTYLIATDAGHILINTGFEDTVPQIVEGVEKPTVQTASSIRKGISPPSSASKAFTASSSRRNAPRRVERYGSRAVMLRFGTWPTGMRVTSRMPTTSTTETEFEPAFAT